MSETKIACDYSDNKAATELYHKFSRKYSLVSPAEADVLIILGGDGFMLHSLHKYMDIDKPFYGINCGTYGFLMNEFSNEDLMDKLLKAQEAILYPLSMNASLKNGKTAEAIAFNEVSLIRHTRQTAIIQVLVNDVERISKLMCDGALVATPAGSTAYNFSAHGPIIPIGSNMLALTPVSPFRPRRWNGALLPHTARVKFINIDPEKRPVYVSADFMEWPDVIEVEVKEDRSKQVSLMFDPDHTLEDRIFNEQFAYGD